MFYNTTNLIELYSRLTKGDRERTKRPHADDPWDDFFANWREINSQFERQLERLRINTLRSSAYLDISLINLEAHSVKYNTPRMKGESFKQRRHRRSEMLAQLEARKQEIRRRLFLLDNATPEDEHKAEVVVNPKKPQLERQTL